MCNLYVSLDFISEWSLESLAKKGRQVLVSPGSRECVLGVRVSVTPVGHRGKRSWDGEFRAEGYGR
jgi:hypothetical protein